jgi:hypothetical protein
MEFILSELKVKERPMLFNGDMVRAILDGRKTQTRRIVKGMALDWLDKAKFTSEYVALSDNDMCPNGKAGDHIWVREAFSAMGGKDGHALPIFYKADGDDGLRWTPSIHMPRWASRIQLEMTSIRIERLQDISEADAEAEGIECINQPTGGDDYQDYWRNYAVTEKEADGWPWFTGDPIASFKTLWNSIYKNWNENPWVLVIEFKLLKEP